MKFSVSLSSDELLHKILSWGAGFSYLAVYPGNGYHDAYEQHELLFAAGARRVIAPSENRLDVLYNTWTEKPCWLFGYLSYDLKNELEALSSNHSDDVSAPDLQFFEPEVVGYLRSGILEIEADDPAKIIQDILQAIPETMQALPQVEFTPRLSKEQYLNRVHSLQRHIQLGDIYEVNFCQEFYARQACVSSKEVFKALNQRSHPPFAAFFETPDHAVMCASPERYLQKKGNRLVSQPIKGTSRRLADSLKDEQSRVHLRQSVKERAENVMIVDLVRNDLSKVAARGTVEVPELFGVYTFPTVHQLISTVTAEMDEAYTWADALRATFPMGSMTGAPKVSAMQLAEQHELHKRGIYSGAMGYISPEGDFDFNVVIRSLLYNKHSSYLSLSVGGAITILADAEEEYKECLLKAEAIVGLFR